MNGYTFFDFLPFGIWLTPKQAREIATDAQEAHELFVMFGRAVPGTMSVN